MERATTADKLKAMLRIKGPGLVFGMIQKQRNGDAVGAGLKAADLPTRWPDPHGEPEPAEVLNEDESILVLVDEAHRGQAGDLHAALQVGLPNCARIGFTGTPTKPSNT